MTRVEEALRELADLPALPARSPAAAMQPVSS